MAQGGPSAPVPNESVPDVERRFVVGRLLPLPSDDPRLRQDDNVVERRYEGYLAAVRGAPIEEIQGIGRGRRIVMIAPGEHGRP